MASWVDFAAAEPALASAVRALLCQYGTGLGYLATVRADGGPRVHPVAPVITAEGLFCFIIRSPKRHDLDRDPRYALHAFPPEESDDEAYLAGRAWAVTDARRLELLANTMGADPRADWKLYELGVDVAMVLRRGLTSPKPSKRLVWRDGGAGAAGTAGSGSGGGVVGAVTPLRPRRQNGPCAAAADSVQ